MEVFLRFAMDKAANDWIIAESEHLKAQLGMHTSVEQGVIALYN